MPSYTTPGQAKLLRDNTQGILWAGESVPASTLSIGFLLERINRSFYPWGLSFEVSFSGAPGTFEIDLMAANTDTAGSYIQIGAITTVNGSNVGRWDMPSNIWPKYVAGYIKTLTNAVNTTLIVTK